MRLGPPRRHVARAQPAQLQLQGVCGTGRVEGRRGCRARCRGCSIQHAEHSRQQLHHCGYNLQTSSAWEQPRAQGSRQASLPTLSCAASSITVGLMRPPSHLSTSRPAAGSAGSSASAAGRACSAALLSATARCRVLPLLQPVLGRWTPPNRHNVKVQRQEPGAMYWRAGSQHPGPQTHPSWPRGMWG